MKQLSAEVECRKVIPQPVWSEFLAQFSQDNRGHLITLKVLDYRLGAVEIANHKPLFAIAYDSSPHKNELVVTVNRTLNLEGAIHSHMIFSPRRLEVIKAADGSTVDRVVIGDARGQTSICLDS